uniref:Small ribosomal subunit protein uS2m n=1 Tax=Romanomermis culicivorax TaxID=13658 RepID=A0A915IBW5_ROMCU
MMRNIRKIANQTRILSTNVEPLSETATVPTRKSMIQRALNKDDDLIVTTTRLTSHRITYKHNPELEKEDPFYAALAHPDYFQVSKMFTMRQLMEARVFWGHKVGTLCPEMKQYLFGERLDVCVFDLDKTAAHLRSALNFLAHMAYRGGIILFVTNDRWHVHEVEKAAKQCGEYSHCHKFIVGQFTNAAQLFRHTIRYPDVVVFLSTVTGQMQQHPMVVEAAKLQISTVGIVDSNCNPNIITYPIPGNDDSLVSIQFYLKVFKEAILAGKAKRREHFGAQAMPNINS